MNNSILEKGYLSALTYAKAHYENFPVVSFFVPAQLRKHVAIVYQFARQADDIADEGDFSRAERLNQLNAYEHRFNQAFISESEVKLVNESTDSSAMIMSGSYLNWEFRYPFRSLGATRAKIYVARYMKELHIGFKGRELSVAGSTFDFSFDALVKTPQRKKQYVFDILVQRIASSWGFSSFALGPSVTFGYTQEDKFDVTAFFVNARLKIGTSL